MPVWNQLVDLVTSGLLSLARVTGSGGVAIVTFTIAVRLLLAPLTLAALRNARRQRELAPLLREVRERHREDRAAAACAQMALYKEHGFDPAGGCLPMLVQMPIFLALWRAIRALGGTSAGTAGFLWLHHLSRPDPLHLLPVLAACAQYAQSRMALPSGSGVTNSRQRPPNAVVQCMPCLTVLLGWKVASGAVLYWVVSGLCGVAMQYAVNGWGSLADVPPLRSRDPARLGSRSEERSRRAGRDPGGDAGDPEQE